MTKLKTLKDIEKEPIPHWNDRPYARSLDPDEDKKIVKKLKTLKDLEYDCGDRSVVNYHELKQEAIKWVKTLDWNRDACWKARIEWITHFFNITEEDLK